MTTLSSTVNDKEQTKDEQETLHHRLLGPSIQKSGQDGVDQTAVSEIIYKVSEGSKYFEHQKKKEAELSVKVEGILRHAAKVSKQDLEGAQVRITAMIKQLESTRDLSQSIVHVDCDAFYASVEELDRPELKTKPFGVGGGILCTCNYEARKFGVRSAMALFVARKICPELIVIPLSFPKYIEKSNAIKAILRDYDPKLCAMTLDEAYLNITDYCARTGQAREEVVLEMRERVHKETGLTISAGIGPNCRVAKIASNFNKPNGQYVIANDREAVMEFMDQLPVRKITGVGYVLERQLKALKVDMCGDIFKHAPLLHEVFTDITVDFLLNCYLGLGSTVVRPIEEYKRKSVSSERTFRAVSDFALIKQKLLQVAKELEQDCRRHNVAGRKLGMKLKKATFETITRTKSVPKPVKTWQEFYRLGLQMVEKEMPVTVRLVGLRVSELVDLSYEGPMKTFLKGGKQQRSGTEVEGQSEFEALDPQDDEGELNMLIQESQEYTEEQFKEEVQAPSPAHENTDDLGAKDIVSCPICGNQVSADMSVVNQHIDWCLSRGAIRDAVKNGGP
ncbi:hypothetical protein V1512DRAFT_286978 [Lipomyces arxii]|uniref:uncharacterized protein n=1 Tax=Lipomyces arxii TaxID=56418 RepID=UPI0034CE0FC2